MATESQIQALIDQGWGVVPIRPGQKNPDAKEWTTRIFTPADFNPDDNVGTKNGEPSGWRVDVDCDDPGARVAANIILPPTLRSGRRGNYDSHHWFVTPDAVTKQFHGLENEMLVELRSNGSQTVLPPSTHRGTGEPIEWSTTKECDRLMEVDYDHLLNLVAAIATACLVAKFWPGEGGRHRLSGHFSGALLRCGVPPDLLVPIITAVCYITGDTTEIGDRTGMATSTKDKFVKGLPVTGGPMLAEQIEGTPALLGRISRWFGKEGVDQLDAMNEKHFVVKVGNNIAIASEEPDQIELHSFETFQKMYCNQYVGKKRLGQFWIDHPMRRTYRRLVFAPPEAPVPVHPEDYNLWRGFTVDASTQPNPERHCKLYFRHIHEIISRKNIRVYNWILDFMADAVQRPGVRVGKALVIRGKQGTGKSLFVETFGKLFGRAFMAVQHRDQIVGHFNSHLSGKILIFADEAVWGGRRDDVGILKALVTQDSMTITRKGIDSVTELNCLRLMCATNEKWAWPAGNNERRGVVIDADPDIREHEYFQALVNEIEKPEFLPSLLACLKSHNVDYKRLRAGVVTLALKEQQEFSAEPVQQWWREILDEGVWPGIAGGWPAYIPHHELYEEYTRTMGPARGAGFTHRGTKMALVSRLRELLPENTVSEVRKARVNINEGRAMPAVIEMRDSRVLMMPPLSRCRDAYDRVSGFAQEWSEPVVVGPGTLDLEGDAA